MNVTDNEPNSTLSTQKKARVLKLVCALTAMIWLIFAVAYFISKTHDQGKILLQWDMAGYFQRGHELYLDHINGDWSNFWRDLREMTFYPPAHPLLLSAWFHVLPPSPYSARLLILLMFALGGLLTFALAQRHISSPSALLVLLFFLASPLYVEFAGENLMEVPGMLLTLLFAYLYFPRRDGQHARIRSCRWFGAGIILTCALFTKYNFALFLISSLLVYHFAELVLSIKRAEFRSGLYRALSPALLLLSFIAIPLLIWLAVIGREGIQSIQTYLVNVPATAYSRSDIRYWTYYFVVICRHYFISPYLGLFSLALFGWFLIRYAKLSPFWRFSCAYILAVLILMTTHYLHANRMVFTALPFLWLITVRWITLMAQRISTRTSSSVTTGAFVLLLVLGMFAAARLWAVVINDKRALEQRDARLISPALDYIKTQAAQDHKALSITGSFNWLSPHLIVSEFELQHKRVLRKDGPDLWLDIYSPDNPQQTLKAWQDNRPLTQKLITIEVLPDSPYYIHRNPAKEWVIPQLQRGAAFVEADRLVLPEAGIRLTLWSRRAGDRRQ